MKKAVEKTSTPSIFNKNVNNPMDVALGLTEPAKGPKIIVMTEPPKCPPKISPNSKKVIEEKMKSELEGEKAHKEEEQNEALASMNLDKIKEKKE